MENGWIVFVLLGLLAVIGASAAAGATGTVPDPGETIEKVKMGMSQSDVKDIMGIPDDIHSTDTGDMHYSQWVYRTPHRTFYIYFEDYRVTAIQD